MTKIKRKGRRGEAAVLGKKSQGKSWKEKEKRGRLVVGVETTQIAS